MKPCQSPAKALPKPFDTPLKMFEIHLCNPVKTLQKTFENPMNKTKTRKVNGLHFLYLSIGKAEAFWKDSLDSYISPIKRSPGNIIKISD